MQRRKKETTINPTSEALYFRIKRSFFILTTLQTIFYIGEKQGAYRYQYNTDRH